MRAGIGHILVLALMLMGQPGRAQVVHYQWSVTHDNASTATLLALEGSRATLEKSLAVQRGAQSGIWTQAVGAEAYSWLRSYASLIRTARMVKQIRQSLNLLKVPIWTMLPQMGVTAPLEVVNPATGRSVVTEQEVASLSLVPRRYQVGWGSGNPFRDDETLGSHNMGIWGLPTTDRRVSVVMPNADLLKATFGIAPSPFVSDYAGDASAAIDDLQAHFFELVMDSAARLANYGVRMNAQAGADLSTFTGGRMSPALVKTQANQMSQQALGILSELFSIYTECGGDFMAIDRILSHRRGYWEKFPETVVNISTARMAFALNMMTDIHQAMARTENGQVRANQNETDETLAHLGKKRDRIDSNQWVPMWTIDPEDPNPDFYEYLDALLGKVPWGRAVRLQALGCAARYNYHQFTEAEGLRNVLMAHERMRIALEGIETNAKTIDEIRSMNRQTVTAEAFNSMVEVLVRARMSGNATGWGGLQFWPLQGASL